MLKKITRITTQKKNKSRYNIFLNKDQREEFAFSVDEAILIEYRLRKDLELDETTIHELIQKDTIHKAYTMAINYLSYRMRTEKEMMDYLTEKEVDPEHITKIVQRLIREKLIDDQQFAEMFVRSRMNTATKGPELIKKELIDKGVSAQIADNAAAGYPDDVQYEKVQKLIEKKLNRSNKSFRTQTNQLQATLVQKGFTIDVIKYAMAGIEDQKDDEAEWQAIIKQGEKLLRKHQLKFSGYELRQKVTEGLYRKGFTFDLINQFLDEQLEEY